AMSVKVPLLLESAADLSTLLPYLPLMARLSEATQVSHLPESDDAPVAVCQGARLMLKVEVDKAAETARLQKEAEKLQKNIDKIAAKLSKPGYTDKAPAHLVEKDRSELAQLQDRMAKIHLQLQKYR
ncbi:MAG: valine--tRNA ligase, partial [Snodgrassella alvi]|nr:valine--tRNA ligase [Snodgrassella alvi]